MKAKPITKSRKYGRYHGNHIEKALMKRVKKNLKQYIPVYTALKPFLPERMYSIPLKAIHPKKTLHNLVVWFRLVTKLPIDIWKVTSESFPIASKDLARVCIRKLRYAKTL